MLIMVQLEDNIMFAHTDSIWMCESIQQHAVVCTNLSTSVLYDSHSNI